MKQKNKNTIKILTAITFTLILFTSITTATSWWYNEYHDDVEFGEYIYTASRDDTVKRIHKETGEVDKTYTHPEGTVTGVAVDENYIYTGATDGYLTKLEKDGNIVWEENFDEGNDEYPREVYVDRGYIYFNIRNSPDDLVVKMNKETREIDWTYTVSEGGYYPRTIAIDSSKVYVGSTSDSLDGYRYILDKESGEEEFSEFKSRNMREIESKEGAFVVTTGSSPHATERWTDEGTMIWERTTSGTPDAAPALDHNYVYSRLQHSGTRVYDDDTGSTEHTFSPEARGTESDGEMFFLSCRDNDDLYAYDISTFSQEWNEDPHDGETIYEIASEIVLLYEEPTINTLEPENVTHDSVILRGNLTDLGEDLEELELWIYGREKGETTWDENYIKNSTQTTAFNLSIGVKPNTTYEYKAVAKGTVDGTEVRGAGEIINFDTKKSPFFEIEIDHPEDGDEYILETGIENGNKYIVEENITLNYTVENKGDVNGTQNITSMAMVDEDDGELLHSNTTEDVELEGEGGTYEEHFNWTFEESGEYRLIVESEDDYKEISITILEEELFEVEIISPEEGDELREHETITINYTVENTGDIEDTQEVNLTINEELVQKENITLPDGEEEEKSYTWDERKEPIEYTLTLRSEDDEDSVTLNLKRHVREQPAAAPGQNTITVLILFAAATLFLISTEFKHERTNK